MPCVPAALSDRWLRHWLPCVCLCVCAAALGACAEPLDYERRAAPRGTFGQELFVILHEDLTRGPAPGPQKAAALDVRRDGFVWAVDALLTAARLPAVEGLLQRAFPDITSGLVPGFVRKVGGLLEAVAADGPLLAEVLADRPAPPSPLAEPDRLDLYALALDLPNLSALLDLGLDLAQANDGREGRPHLLPMLLTRLSAALTDLGAPDDDPNNPRDLPDPDGFLGVAARALLRADPVFAGADGQPPTRAVALDPRGLPQVRRNDIGALPAPFTDGDSDGLPDADRHPDGFLWFVGADGLPLPTAALAPFASDASGLPSNLRRADDGRLQARGFTGDDVYVYLDLEQTPLAFLLREAVPLVRDDLPFDLFTALKPTLGPRVTLEPGDPASPQAFSAQNQLVGLASALLLVLDHPDAPALLQSTQTLLLEHHDLLATLLDDLAAAADTLDRLPTDLAPASGAVEALLPILLEIAQTPGLLEDLLAALSAPTMRAVPEAALTLLSHRAGFIAIDPDGPYETCYQACNAASPLGSLDRMQCIQACPNAEIFQEALPAPTSPPATPPTLADRSLFERTLGVIWETAGQPYNVRFIQFNLNGLELLNVTDVIGDALTIDNMADAYLRALVGDLALADVLNPQLVELSTPLGLDNATMTDVMLWVCANILDLDMSANPTPGQLTRLFNKRPLGLLDATASVEMNLATCRSGRLCIDAHADALYAAEASGLIDALHPLAMAFHAHGRLDLLIQLFDVLYAHYPAPTTLDRDANGDPIPGISPDNLRSLEPALRDILSTQPILAHAADLADVARGLDRDFGADRSRFVSALEGTLRHLLTADPSLRLVTGEDALNKPPKAPISPLRPLDLLLEPLDQLSAQIDADPAASAAWERAIDRLLDLVLARSPSPADPTTARFTNPAGLRLGVIALDELRTRWLALDARGERTQALRRDYPDALADAFTSPWLPLLIDLLDWMDSHPSARADLRITLVHLLQDGQPTPEQVLLLTYDLLPTLLDLAPTRPLLRVVAPYLAPDRVWPTALPTDSLPLWQHAVDLLTRLDAIDPDRLTHALLLDALRLRDGEGRSPGWHLGQALADTHRLQPGASSDLSAEDAAYMLREVAGYLADDRRGFERAVDLIGFVLANGGGPKADATTPSPDATP